MFVSCSNEQEHEERDQDIKNRVGSSLVHAFTPLVTSLLAGELPFILVCSVAIHRGRACSRVCLRSLSLPHRCDGSVGSAESFSLDAAEGSLGIRTGEGKRLPGSGIPCE